MNSTSPNPTPIHQGINISVDSTQNTSSVQSTTSATLAMSFHPEMDVADLTPLLNDANIFILRLILFVIFSIIYGMFGVCTNLINIVIFVKQGLFSGGSTLNLFFLSIADLGVSFTLSLWGMGFAIVVAKIPGLPVAPFSIIYLAFGWPHVIFTTINRILTAYVAFERCMCVVIPFRVKNIFAPRKNLVYLIVIFTYGIFSHVPIYTVHSLGEVIQKGTNISQLDLVFGPDREFWHDLVYYGNYLVLSISTAVIVIVCTLVTSAYVQTSKAWRKKASFATSTVTTPKAGDVGVEGGNIGSNEKGDKKLSKSAVDKETRLVKMITTISVIFCICYIPEVALIVIRSFDPRINTGAQYQRLSHVLHAVKFHTATVNSGINIFVYYRMSTKYRQIFLSYFGKGKDTA